MIRDHTLMSSPKVGGGVKTYCNETIRSIVLGEGGGSKNWSFSGDVINVQSLARN